MPLKLPSAPVARDPRDNNSQQIGVKLRRLRTEQDLTILQLAERAGVSSGIISQIERGNSNPSIKTLQRIRAALGVNLWEFLDEKRLATIEPDVVEIPQAARMSQFVRRKADRPQIVVGTTQLVKELLSPRNDRNLRFMIVTLPPGGESEDVIMGEGEKGGLVTEGRIELIVGSEVTELLEGDSFQFPSSLPHKICNLTEETAKVIWIMSVLDSHI